MSSQTITTTKWLQRIWKPLILIIFIVFLLNFALAATSWRTLSKGLEYRDIDRSYITPWSHIHTFRIDLNANKLSSIMAKDLALKHASADEYAKHSKALISINGGFFDEEFHPLGLRITDSHLQSPMKQISWWGVFYTRNNKAHVVAARQFKRDKQINFAIQSGPRLLINGRIPPLKPGRAERSALGVTADGKVILLVTDNSPLSTTELAQIMKAAPLNCMNAINLDGGSSSQLRAQIDKFHLNVHGFSNVSDAVVVTPLSLPSP
ncbi:phosphodiester glycosidase family protein [Legionella dresdenensis]|uniref:Phosphodiester glycosidase family protein n=1 Tax=Legionella dresdenensis TaxID=450200 RepID=A0ABV8CCK2_9GAMM